MLNEILDGQLNCLESAASCRVRFDPSPTTDVIPPDIIFRVIRQFAHLLVRGKQTISSRGNAICSPRLQNLVSNCAPPLLQLIADEYLPNNTTVTNNKPFHNCLVLPDNIHKTRVTATFQQLRIHPPITDVIPPDIIFRVIRQFTHPLVRENKRYPRERKCDMLFSLRNTPRE
ncbi:hypothetical protein CEXT_766641 [Caerostris extrusa]|uniref:Uncharacterized protein n=1 Tax=Caerostris extrusa TaxID=172846 RepID=A0AAV4WEC9_CAEEX|nr:hypothetical protein CEXT_766641 [Caerostris extrusa]